MSLENNILSFEAAQELMAKQISDIAPTLKKDDVHRIEIKIHPIDEMLWLKHQKDPIKIYGANQDNTASIAGIGQAQSMRGEFLDLVKLFIQLHKALRPQYPYLQWYGGFAFDGPSQSPLWKEFGSYRFIIPRFELASDGSQMIFCCNLFGKHTSEAIKDLIKQLKALTNNQVSEISETPIVETRHDFPNRNEWNKQVEDVLSQIKQKKLAKVVLARASSLSLQKAINCWDVMARLSEVTPNSYHFCFEFGKSAFLGASPERLYKRMGNTVLTEAIAGTIKRGAGVSQDNQQKEQLLSSAKNNHEHDLVVKAIADALKQSKIEHTHDSKPHILTLANGHHLITRFEGKLKSSVVDGSILDALHPTPAVGGWPKQQALTYIKERENFDRGWYTGAIGYVGYYACEFVVGIRCALLTEKQMSLYAGAGIVNGSNAEDEWQEIENKISNFLKLVR